MKVLLCAPPEGLEGGISAVVAGLEEGLKSHKEIAYKRICYGKIKRVESKIQQAVIELILLVQYTFQIFLFQPNVIQIETSFDKKTVIRDSIHLWLALLFGKKIILHAHGGEWHLIPKWSSVWQKYVRLFIKYCEAIVVTSLEERNIILKVIGESDKIFKISNPVIVPQLKNILDHNSEKKKIVFASRIIETKGILDAIEAISLIRTKNIELRVYGNGTLLKKAKALSTERGIEDKVTFLGEVNLDTLFAEYSLCDIYIFPSFHLEGFPMSFFFAVGVGAPIITTRVRPIPEYLKEPDNCLYIEKNNPKMLAEKIDLLLNNSEMCNRMKENNKNIIKKFSPEIIIKEFLQIYNSLSYQNAN